jgi:hypothetical protein
MKKILLLAIVSVFTLATMAQSSVDSTIKMNVEKHDFGKIKQNIPVTYSFEIKNVTDHPVVVENTWASCGCTTPEKITDPIMPGSTATLKVQYNAMNVAPFTKDVYIKLSGIEQPKTVQITGEVLTVEAYEEYVKSKTKPKPNN